MTETSRALQYSQLDSIRPDLEAALESHVTKTNKTRNTISLDPYTLVPLDRYSEFRTDYLEHVARWEENGIDIDSTVRSTLLVNTSTEENLPWYTTANEIGFPTNHNWTARWTAEERSHGETMVRLIESRGILDMSKVWLPTRELNMVAGINPEIVTPADGFAYVATQELLTRKAHFNSARIMDPAAIKSLRAIGADEGRHYQYYASALRALARVSPDAVLAAMRRQHEGNSFEMPGKKGIVEFSKLARVIALSGIFDELTVLEAQKQTIDETGLLEVKPETEQGKRDSEWAQQLSGGEDKAWERKRKFMEAFRARAARSIDSDQLRPFILGHTVELTGSFYTPISS